MFEEKRCRGGSEHMIEEYSFRLNPLHCIFFLYTIKLMILYARIQYLVFLNVFAT